MRILPDGVVISGIKPPEIKTDGKRRLGNWIASFLDYTEQLECPIDYLRWVALSTIAGAAQRKVSIDSEYFYYMTNMYVILVGEPGSKKSVAIRQGKKILKKVPGINLTSDAPSVVGVMEDFKEITNREHQSLNAFMLELSTLYENAKESMTGFLTAMYDGDDDYIKRTRIAGKEKIPYPWLNLLAGTTPSWMGDNVTKSAIEGGLVARTIYVFGEVQEPKTPRPKSSPALRKLLEDLIHDAAHIAGLGGEFAFDGGDNGEAAQWYDAWYMNKRGRQPRVTDHRTQSYYQRKPQHLIKTAMAVSLSMKDTLTLTANDLQIALALLESNEAKLPRAFSSVGGNIYANDLERVRAQVFQAGEEGLNYGDILAINYHSIEKRMLDQTLEALIAMGELIKPLGNPQYYHEDYDPRKLKLTSSAPTLPLRA